MKWLTFPLFAILGLSETKNKSKRTERLLERSMAIKWQF